MKQNLRYSLLMLLLAVFTVNGFADRSFTFVQTSKTEGTLTDAPDGVSYEFSSTYNQKFQLTANNSMTLTIKGLTPNYTLTGLTLDVKNNARTGSGTVTVTQGENELGTYTITGLGGTYQEKKIDITPTSSEGDIVVTISASENSVYCDKFTFFYSDGKTDIATLNSISPTQLEVNDEGAFTLDATFAEGTVAGVDYEVSWSSGNEDVLLMVDATTGEFMAIDAGTVDVTVSVTVLDDETYNEVSKTFAVTVKAPMTFETVNLPYEESFAGSFGMFQADGAQAGATDVWTSNSSYAKASAYVSGTRYPGESYFFSPIIDLTHESAATLTFSHTGRYFGTLADEAKLVVRQKDGDLWGEWEPITINDWFSNTSWTFVDAEVDLTAYAGKQVQLAFVYICPSTDVAGTWEIKNLAIANASKVDIATINGISPTTVNVEDEGTFELDAIFAEGTVADEDYEISWTSSDPTILEVAGNMYEAKATGTVEVTVSVTVLDDTKYNEVSETFSVTVTEPFDATAYELVTDASTLADGDEIIIAYVADNTAVAMGEQKTANRSAVGVQVNSDGILVNNADVQLITLEKDGDIFYFNVGDGYLYASSGSANQMKTEDEADDNAKATITIDNGEATITFQGSNARNIMRYNPNNGNPIFSCYSATSSVQTCPQIYRKAEPVTVTVGQHGYASYCGDKNLDFSATELKAYAVTEVKDGLMMLTEFEDGYKAGEGAVLKGDEGEYQVPVATTATAVAGNMLIGNNSDEAITVEADGSTYRFGYSPAAQKVGFMKATSNFTVASGKAYLKINSTNNAPAFLSFDGTATGIDAANVSTTAADGQRYNLNGQRVNSNYRGVVIVDGKKLIQK